MRSCTGFDNRLPRSYRHLRSVLTVPPRQVHFPQQTAVSDIGHRIDLINISVPLRQLAILTPIMTDKDFLSHQRYCRPNYLPLNQKRHNRYRSYMFDKPTLIFLSFQIYPHILIFKVSSSTNFKKCQKYKEFFSFKLCTEFSIQNLTGSLLYALS